MNLAHGEKEMMALIAKKKKTRKPVGIFNMGRRFKCHAKQVQAFDIPSDEDDNWKEDDRSIKAKGGRNIGSGKIPNEEYYSNE